MADVEIKGMKELYEALSTKIPRRLEGRYLQKALSAGTSEVIKVARRNARRGGSGTLARAIYAKRGRKSSPIQEVRYISVRKGKRFQSTATGGRRKKSADAYYARFVEYGRGLIRPDKKEVLRFTGRDGEVVYTKQSGPMRPRPFMRPAWDSTKEIAVRRFRDKLGELFEDSVRRARF